MRFADMVFRSLARRISSIMAEYDASVSGASSSMSCQYKLGGRKVQRDYSPAMVVVLRCCAAEVMQSFGDF
jgi:hypothetical protein